MYDELGEKEKALAYIQKAATTASQSRDNRLLCYIYYFWGRIIQSEKPYQDAINKIFLSEKYARALNDTFLIVSRLKDLSWSYLFLKNYTKSDSLISHALRLAYKSKRYNDLPLLYNKKSFISFEQKKYIKSLNEINKAIRYITYTSDSLKIFNRKGRILIELNQLDSARYYIEKGKNLTSFYGKAVYHNEIADIEAKNNNYEDAFVYKLRYANLLDSISEERENKSVMEYQKRYDYTQVKAENDKLKIENQQKTISLLWSAIIIILLMIGGWIVYLRFKRIMTNKINAKDKMLEDSIMMLRNKKDELFIQKQESYEKESELSSRLMNKEEELKFLQAQQREFKENLFKMNDVVQKIESIRTLNETQKIKSSASLALSESDFNNLMEAINLCYNDFVDRLKAEFPELSNADLYLCALLKMKIDNKDIGFLLNVSASTLKKRKYRLKADKLNSQNDDQTLDDFIEAY